MEISRVFIKSNHAGAVAKNAPVYALGRESNPRPMHVLAFSATFLVRIGLLNV
jgi:hypothetical protein